MTDKKKPLKAYTIHIELAGFDPPIWRRVLVLGDMDLEELHQVIQSVMPWDNSHLHEFEIKKRVYAMPEIAEEDELFPLRGQPRLFNEEDFTLGDLITRRGMKFLYRYDFGDDWEHVLTVEGAAAPQEGQQYPYCLGGEMAAPPEDCGGPYGYYSLLQILADPEDEEHESMLDWVGGEWDQNHFDLDQANKRLKKHSSYVAKWRCSDR